MLNLSRHRSLTAIGLAICGGIAASRGTQATQATQPSSPQATVEELLTADVSFSAASTTRGLVNGLGAMFAEDVIVPLPGRGFVEGKAAVMAALRDDSLNATSRAVWSPVRGGISADGRHGFTYGYMTVMRPDGSRLPLKYLSYWVKGDAGWRVAVFRRSRRAEGDVSMAMMPPALPDALVAATTDIGAIDSHRTSLAKAESDFSDEAQRIGVGPAFTKYGGADAMNMGGPASATFVVGNELIGKTIGGDDPSAPATISWSSDRVIVASSGDLGVSIGHIRQNAAAAAGIPFFTIWRRAGKDAPWRYVAE
jgi:hypothetical protein